MLLPKHYQQLESLPSDPPMLKVYGTTTESFKGFIKVFPISEKEMMPFNKD